MIIFSLAMISFYSITAQSIHYSAPVDILNGDVTSDEGAFSVTPQEANVSSMNFSPDGTKMFILGENDSIYQYTLDVPFDITQGVSYDGDPYHHLWITKFNLTKLTFSEDGLRMLLVGGGRAIYQFILTTPFDITQTVSSRDFRSFNTAVFDTSFADISFSPDGKKLFLLGGDSRIIFQLDMNGIPFDFTAGFSYSSGNSFQNRQASFVRSFAFDPSGTKLLITGGQLIKGVYQYTLSTPFEISTVNYDGNSFRLEDSEPTSQSVSVSPDGTKMFVAGDNGSEVNQYTIASSNIFTESLLNDGSVEGSMIISIVDDQFTNPGDAVTGFSIENLPDGLGFNLTSDASGSYAELTLTGNASNSLDENDVQGIVVNFENSAFVGNDVTVFSNAVDFDTKLGIDFINEGLPVFLNSIDTIEFIENSQDVVIDVDANNGANTATDEGVVYSLQNGLDTSLFTINSNTGVLIFTNAPDFESPEDSDFDNQYLVEITVSNSTFTSSFSTVVSVVNINEAPVVADQNFSIDENSLNATVLGIISATDDDGDNLNYSIVSDVFEISDDGQISVIDSILLNFEVNPVFSIDLEVNDGLLTSEAMITINLNDVQEAPAFTESSVSFTIDENLENSTIVGSLSATDDDGDDLVYSTDSQIFGIDSSTGQLMVIDMESLNFEINPTLTFNVVVSDGELTDETTIVVMLNDVNDAPTIENTTFSIFENLVNESIVGNIMASDEDENSLVYSMDSEILAINQNGQITVMDNTQLDFEVTPSFSILVQVSDGIVTTEASIEINLMDINDIPIVQDQIFQIEEHSDNGILVGIIEAFDPEDDVITFSILSGNELGGFSLDSGTGELVINDGAVLDFEVNPAFSLEIGVFDDENEVSLIVTIQLIDIEDPLAATIPSLLGLVKVYPVPTDSELNILIKDRILDISRINLFDSSGKNVDVIKKSIDVDQIQLDLSLLPNGIYLLRIVDENESSTFRINKTSR